MKDWDAEKRKEKVDCFSTKDEGVKLVFGWVKQSVIKPKEMAELMEIILNKK
jgi:hypothetical protein